VVKTGSSPCLKFVSVANCEVLHYGQGLEKVLVFCQTKADANDLSYQKKKLQMNIEVMHGDIAQHMRELTLEGFKRGRFQVLVATDVASRGLDIPNVDLVVQIEPPNETETYIHRSGRTARAGAEGLCITLFCSRAQNDKLFEIETRCGIKMTQAPLPTEATPAFTRA